MNELKVKKELYDLCQKYVDEKIKNASDAIENAQKSANEETKSSVGDKYETGRSMLQMERNKFEIQLKESLLLKEFLDQINVGSVNEKVIPGSVVITENANYFIAINSGKQQIDGKTYFTISLASPVGKILSGKTEGDQMNFNGKSFKIVKIY